MAKFIKVILVTLFLYVSVHCIGQPFEIEFDRVEILNKTYVDGFYNVSTLRVQKFNRTKHVVNLNAELLMDIDETIFMEINFYYNRLNNNQYSKTPARLPKTALCKVFDTYYRDLYMENFKEASNFPQYQPDEPACPINKGHYWMKNFILSSEKMPKSIPEGNWIAEFIVYKGDEASLVIHFYYKTIGFMGR